MESTQTPQFQRVRADTATVAWPLRIWFDGACPLCAREMAALDSADVHGRLDLVDCAPAGFGDPLLVAAGVPVSELGRLIHARDAEGHWYRGIDVFVLAYAAAGLHGTARFWSQPLLRPLWDRIYPWIARHRLRLSRLGLTRPWGWLIERAARRALARSASCSKGVCELPKRPGAA